MEQQRKLVTFRTISKIIPIANADRICIAVIDGWRVIVSRGEFEVGQTVVYFEVDSLLPITEEFEFLRKYSSYVKKSWLPTPNNEGFRIKTVKLRGELSQGLVIPIPKSLQMVMYDSGEVDIDLDAFFNVIKYDPPAVQYNGPEGKKGNFPEFIPKTKEERVQNISAEKLRESFDNGEKFEKSRKYDGESITVYCKIDLDNTSIFTKALDLLRSVFWVDIPTRYKTGVCSHNIEIDKSFKDNRFIKVANESNALVALEKLCKYFDEELAIQGEVCGPGIRGNRHGFNKPTIVIFNVYDIKNQCYKLPEDRRRYVNSLIHEHGFLGYHVKLEFSDGKLFSTEIDDILSVSEFLLATGKENEGIVYKSLSRDFSFKAISNDYLLEED